MRIAFISDAYRPRINGVTISIDSFRSELEKRGHISAVLCPQYPDTSPGLNGDNVYRFVSIPMPVSMEDRLVLPTQRQELDHAMRHFRPDVVHANSEGPMLFLTRSWCATNGIPMVITYHTNWEFYAKKYLPWLPGFFVRELLYKAYEPLRHIIIPSASMAPLLQGYGIPGPFHILPTGIDPTTFIQSEEECVSFKKNLYLKAPHLAGKRLLLFVGRICEEKNLAFLVEVLKAVNYHNGNVALLLMGDGPFRKDLAYLFSDAGLTNNTYFFGFASSLEVKLAYKIADVFVFPSLTETQGLVTLEAMMSGLPVVAIGEMGTKDLMMGNNGGYMVREDTQEFSDAILALLSDTMLQKQKSEEAKAWAAKWHISPLTDRLLDYYEYVLRENYLSVVRK